MMMGTKVIRLRSHLDFLDGIRGLAALYVLFFHVFADGNEKLTKDGYFLNLLRFGHEAVVVFIVLSGFVLTLPLIRSMNLEFKGGLRKFIFRRARRILPGYYAALLMFPVYLFIVEIFKGLSGDVTDWRRIQELFFSGDMLSHLFLAHNISSKWECSINPVLWSMATEWWIYFVFAFFLIPIWKRFSAITAFLGTIFLGLIPVFLLKLGLPSLYGHPHLIMAFGFGMASAALIYSDNYSNHSRGWNYGLNVAICLSILLFCGITIIDPGVRLSIGSRFITDLLIATMTAGFITKISLTEVSGFAGSWITLTIKRFLELKLIVALGAFSYSLYLTHLVVLNIIGTTLNLAPIKARVSLSFEPMSMRLWVLVPVLLLFAYGFYRVFEKPFLGARSRQSR
jgi:peptidoglycan/LPS O-acetylase OafA/YrhL